MQHPPPDDEARDARLEGGSWVRDFNSGACGLGMIHAPTPPNATQRVVHDAVSEGETEYILTHAAPASASAAPSRPPPPQSAESTPPSPPAAAPPPTHSTHASQAAHAPPGTPPPHHRPPPASAHSGTPLGTHGRAGHSRVPLAPTPPAAHRPPPRPAADTATPHSHSATTEASSW